jgi:spermidine dehydrogenase
VTTDVVRREYLDGSTYPPVRTGMRGSHPGSFDVAHAIRDGRTFDVERLPVEERVDLVVVGAGISGLAAAWFWRRRRPDDSIVLLDNHDDFGGHAKRNEFHLDGRMLLGYGGSEAMQSPHSLYSEVAAGLVRSLGVDIDRFDQAFDRTLYPSLGLSRGVFFTREAFGVDRLVTGDPMRMVADDIPPDRMNARPIAEFVGDFPVSAASKERLVELFTSDHDPLHGLAAEEALALLATTSYRDYVSTHWGLDDEAADTFQGRSHDFFALGIDAVSALDAMECGYPGFAGLHLPQRPEAAAEMDEPYIYHFPDGNASLARLMVRSLIPTVAPGTTMDDIVTDRFDYTVLDEPGALTRVRLLSTVVHVANRDVDVDVGYVHEGVLHRVRARRCVLAGYHMMIPRIMPELAEGQRHALRANVKAPLAYVKVLVRNWHPWVHMGVHEITNPMGFFSRLKLDYPVSLGDYRCPRSPDEPMVLHLVHVPAVREPGIDLRQRLRDSRQRLYDTTFADVEARVRDELTRMLGPGGLDADCDIAAITVNRWGHGYSYSRNALFDVPADGPEPFELARAPVGRIAIANSDAAWSAFAHSAIDQAHRAVEELLQTRRRGGVRRAQYS